MHAICKEEDGRNEVFDVFDAMFLPAALQP